MLLLAALLRPLLLLSFFSFRTARAGTAVSAAAAAALALAVAPLSIPLPLAIGRADAKLPQTPGARVGRKARRLDLRPRLRVHVYSSFSFFSKALTLFFYRFFFPHTHACIYTGIHYLYKYL